MKIQKNQLNQDGKIIDEIFEDCREKSPTKNKQFRLIDLEGETAILDILTTEEMVKSENIFGRILD